MQEAAQELAQLDAEIEFNPCKHDPRVTLKAGRRADEFAKDAQRHLKVCSPCRMSGWRARKGCVGLLRCIAGMAGLSLSAAGPRAGRFRRHCNWCAAGLWCVSRLELVNSMLVLQEALQNKPHSAADACLLAQIHCSRGKVAEASQLVDALVEAAPDSADVQALKLLLCQLPQQSGPPQSQAERLLDLLRVDPGSREAVSGAVVAHHICTAARPQVCHGSWTKLEQCCRLDGAGRA